MGCQVNPFSTRSAFGVVRPGQHDHQDDPRSCTIRGRSSVPANREHTHHSARKRKLCFPAMLMGTWCSDRDLVEIARAREVLSPEDGRIDDVEEDQQAPLAKSHSGHKPQSPGERDAAEESENRGGSPIGVSRPPPLATMEDEEDETSLSASGRVRAHQRPMRSNRGPVVPMMEASTAPIPRTIAFSPAFGQRPRMTIRGDDEQGPEQEDERQVLAAGVHDRSWLERGVQIATGAPRSA